VSALPEDLEAELGAWRSAGLERRLESPHGVDFTSNDYLGLRRHPRLVAAARKALETWGVGAGAARLLRGNLPPHEAAEAACAEWLGTEAALLLPSGYHANLALLGACVARGDVLFSDALNHASLIDGARLTQAERVIFPHGDLEHLEDALARRGHARRRIVVVEEVHSMDGDRADLPALLELCARHDAWLVVDRAHGAGLQALTVPPRHPRLLAQVVTGGKALGAAGAFIAGSRTLVDWLVQRGRAFVFTTAPPPAVAAALEAAIAVVRQEPERAARALARAARLRARLRAGGLDAPGESAIVPVVLGSGDRALAVAAAVREAGYEVRAVRPPTVPEGTARLRLVCHADHGEEDVDGVAEAVLAACAAHPGPAAPARAAVPAAPMLVVTGTDTGVGKTVVSALLCRALRREERLGGYLKPVQTGSDDDTGEVRRLAGLDVGEAPPPLVALPLPASVDQAAAAAGVAVRVADLAAALRRRVTAGAPGRTWVVEGAGGLRVPFGPAEEQGDLFRVLGAPVVVAARSGLGTLNHTLLTLEALARRGLEARALFLVGPPHPANVASLARLHPDLPILGLPWWEDGPSPAGLEAWLDANPLGSWLG